jgi:O-antigen/teichoic acid export membrane protein
LPRSREDQMNQKTKMIQPEYFNKFGSENLKTRAVQGGGIAILFKGVGTVFQIGGIIVLGRLLTPDDFGLVVMGSVITNLFFVFQDVGLADATIQASEIRHEQISTLFWINLSFNTLITLILVALSPLVANFYRRPQITAIMMVSSVIFIFIGLTTQHAALLKRQMLFVPVSLIEITASILSTVAAIILAKIGWRYWAIVARGILGVLIVWLLTWRVCRWRPGLPKRNTGVRSLLRFGSNSVGFYIINYFAMTMDKTLIGKKFGATQVGLYDRANYMATNPSSFLTQSIFHVAVSTLSKLRDDSVKFRNYYLKAIAAISFIGMPLSVFMVVMSQDLFFLLLGPQWNQAAKIFSVLGLGTGMNILYSTNGWLHVSLGRSDRWMRWGFLGSFIMVLGFVIGLFFGPLGVAAAYALVVNLLTFPAIIYAGRPIGLHLKELILAIGRTVSAAVLTGLIILIFKGLLPLEWTVFTRFGISLMAFSILYLGLIILFYRGTAPIREILLLVKIMLPEKFFKTKKVFSG